MAQLGFYGSLPLLNTMPFQGLSGLSWMPSGSNISPCRKYLNLLALYRILYRLCTKLAKGFSHLETWGPIFQRAHPILALGDDVGCWKNKNSFRFFLSFLKSPNQKNQYFSKDAPSRASRGQVCFYFKIRPNAFSKKSFKNSSGEIGVLQTPWQFFSTGHLGQKPK